MKSSDMLVVLVAGLLMMAPVSRAPAAEAAGTDGAKAAEGKRKASKPAEEVSQLERWKAFREHVEKIGKKDLLPPEEPDGKAPKTDGILGTLFRLSPDIATADDLLTKEPPDIAGARTRLAKLSGTEDPYIADYAKLYVARCDLAEKKYPEAVVGFEKVLGSSRNLAQPVAHRGLAESYRGLKETTLEVLELRFVTVELPPEAADHAWAEGRLAEIRRDNPGPLADSEKRMGDLSKRLAEAGKTEGVTGDQAKVEEILIKTAKLLEEYARSCPLCGGT